MIVVGSYDGSIYALDARDGTQLWSVSVGTGMTSAAVVDRTVYVGLFDGGIIALRETGS